MDWRFRSDLPIYSQLVDKIKLGIVSGEMPPGSRLPAVRELAMDAGVNPNTMQRALQELERGGMVYAQRTSGRFVTEDTAVIEGIKKAMAEDLIKGFLSSMAELGYGRDDIAALLKEEKEEIEHADP